MVDVGAYVGVYSLWAAKVVGSDGFVVAFEPNPLAFAWLVRNIELNGAKNVKALPYALGDGIAWITLYAARENPGASSLVPDHVATAGCSVARAFKVPVVTLDYVVESSESLVGRRIEGVDLVKIDVEGYEMRVLEGFRNSLSRGLAERFAIEVHKDQVSTGDVIAFLEGYGYRLDSVVSFGRVKDVVYMRLA
ncbi:FkbM family methyltransferase [Infirmifilum sp.]|uniref:FkbM family methyltransferase n=1 Tax=Infirmifilum sp. TaxID=2856575 RepID=UPI003D12CB90